MLPKSTLSVEWGKEFLIYVATLSVKKGKDKECRDFRCLEVKCTHVCAYPNRPSRVLLAWGTEVPTIQPDSDRLVPH